MKKQWLWIFLLFLGCLASQKQVFAVLSSDYSEHEIVETYLSDCQKSDLNASINIATSNKTTLPEQVSTNTPLPFVRIIQATRKTQQLSSDTVILKRFSTNFNFFTDHSSFISYCFTSSSDFFVVMLRHLLI